MVLATVLLGIAVVLAAAPQSALPQRARYALIGVFAIVAWLSIGAPATSLLVGLGFVGLALARLHLDTGEYHAWLKSALNVSTLLAGIAIAVHVLPLFPSAVLNEPILLSNATIEFSPKANLDKAMVGIVLMLFWAFPATTWQQIGQSLGQAWPAIVAGPAVMVATAWLLGLEWDPKWVGILFLFALSNLLFTVVAEEVVFRGILQNELSKLLLRVRFGQGWALLATAALFGVAHLGGGVQWALLATLAGVIYGLAFTAGRGRYEAPILCHWFTNLAHLFLLQYPG